MTDQTPAFLTITEAARRLGVSRQRIHQRIKAGSLRAVRVQSVTDSPTPTGAMNSIFSMAFVTQRCRPSRRACMYAAWSM